MATASLQIAGIINVELVEYPHADKAEKAFDDLYHHYLSQIPGSFFNYTYPDGQRVYRHWRGAHYEYIFRDGKWSLKGIKT